MRSGIQEYYNLSEQIIQAAKEPGIPPMDSFRLISAIIFKRDRQRDIGSNTAYQEMRDDWHDSISENI